MYIVISQSSFSKLLRRFVTYTTCYRRSIRKSQWLCSLRPASGSSPPASPAHSRRCTIQCTSNETAIQSSFWKSPDVARLCDFSDIPFLQPKVFVVQTPALRGQACLHEVLSKRSEERVRLWSENAAFSVIQPLAAYCIVLHWLQLQYVSSSFGCHHAVKNVSMIII